MTAPISLAELQSRGAVIVVFYTGAAFSNEPALKVAARKRAEILLFDLA